VVIAAGINPESADYIIVIDAARLCRDRTCKERRGNFSKGLGLASKVNNETVFVVAAISPESGGQPWLRTATRNRFTFPFILLFYCSIYCLIRTAQSRAPAQRLAAASVPWRFQTSCFRVGSRHFQFADPRGEHVPALQNFHATEMAM
jgi:hypothetical protein